MNKPLSFRPRKKGSNARIKNQLRLNNHTWAGDIWVLSTESLKLNLGVPINNISVLEQFSLDGCIYNT